MDTRMFTTRPEILGSFGVVTSTHWLASASGMSLLERGGNAFDAAVAAGFVLQVVEPHLVGPAGEVPVLFHSARTGRTEVLCGQGPTPAGATLEHYRSLGLDLIPGNGLLPAVIPGAFDAWMLLLRDHGSMRVRDVLEPAIFYADTGHALMPRISNTIAGLKDFFLQHWPSTAEVYLPGGQVPRAGKLFRNPALARTWRRVLAAAEAAGADRERQIEAARDAFYRGFIAEAIDSFVRNEVMDESGRAHCGVLRASDLAGWSATYEAAATYDYGDYTVAKAGAWSQGPVFLQTLALLKGTDLAAMGPSSADFIHHLTEAMKLAFADREVYYGDPAFTDVPLDTLLSDAYNDARRALIGGSASQELRPGQIPGFEAQLARVMDTLSRLSKVTPVGAPGSEPTLADMRASVKRGDTTHVDVIDRWGNMVSATPSGGWFQSSPVIPELGFGLNTRAQMFWLEPGLPCSLAAGKRPRTTLTPTLALREGKPYMVFGTPGGDQQEQWQLLLFLRHVHHGLNLQEAIDMPMSHTQHFPTSFYPRDRKLGHLAVEVSFGRDVIEDLRRRGHAIEEAPAWSVGRLTAAARDADGLLHAAATPRLMQAYAIGR
ncbi:gamma-glutamyltransferase family protein [Bordetella holmesii]|nr:gamma-glutamyltransferase [Bordetella holmesii H558]AOB36774.1 gamma-glutamyltransferase [Bordetella holmesii]KAK69525.1 putative gamma-glutamyltransferase [Bordetella holmesii H620]KAK88028.1 putative gamma-glutamyltransferase [Bordetella holmesii CDC-H572-BH]KCV02961.1 putative gamma-glutamyltransferase [Bordetella holmesii CDC-H629-BH]KCV04930.1 putative gamma-glutamyltransferase [Bordetella holmesii CDC-H719-BH]